MPRPPAAAPKLSEAAVQKQILAMLAARERLGQLVADRRNTGGLTDQAGRFVRFGKAGDSDIHGTLKGGRTFHVEVKKEGWKPPRVLTTDAGKHWVKQWERLCRVNRIGGIGVVVRSADEADDFIAEAIGKPDLSARVDVDGTVYLWTKGDRK